MSKDILVLTPNGRRQKVHCTPDTSILQVLEDVCAKQGFRPTEYDLKHHNHVLDPTTTIRWSNLPNRATLEMVEAERTRQETNVVIGLLLEDGERRTGEFPPNTSLFELANTLAPAELSSLTHPTILYMRQEVTGELALRNKTLRQLGLIGGRAVLRLLNKAEEGMQANVSAVYRRPLPAKDDKFLESHKEREHTYKETPSSGAPEKQQVQKKVHTETFDPIDLIKKEKGKKTQVKHEEEKTVQIRDSDDNLPTKEDVSMEVDNFEANVKSASSSTSCLSQENLERRLKIEEEVTFLGAQKAIAFIPEGSDEEMEDLPDTFYELTVEEVRRLYSDLQNQRLDLENTPLITASKKEELAKQTSQMRLSAHKHVVVRVQFPDHIILQGIFSPDDTIEVVINFIKAHLQTPDKPFHIFTTPLKETLDPKITLLEAKFVPCVHMHFKWIQEEANAKYLKEEIYSKTTSSDAASILASKYRAPSNRNLNAPENQRTSNAGPSTSKHSKMPKWFKK
ncbi:tether containing UBX domain for GLUT4-like [Choristoneura fumiferana]|uniref:tether containing UBX domain for GLUT4-like n=1 Tax=Choristoneura fumiferana TaxID=7141 RepID=UPI003D15D320